MDQLEIRYGKGQVLDYQKDILSMQICPLFLQQIFVSGTEQDTALVKMEDYVPLIAVDYMREVDVLDTMISLFTGMIEAERRCMFIGEYRVDSGVFCVSRDRRETRLVFVPKHFTNQVALFQELISTLSYMEKKTSPHEGNLIREGIDYISKGNSSITRMRQRFVMIRRKAEGGERRGL
jgi:hypothetical protein